MSGDSEIVVFSLPTCPNCDRVKAALREAGVEYCEMVMDTAAGVTELRINGCFAMEAPVVMYGERFLDRDDLFDANGEVVKFWDAPF